MAVLKHTSPTASVAAPKPRPSNTVPSASTSTAVARKSAPAGWAEAGDSISLIGEASDSAENRDEGAGGQARIVPLSRSISTDLASIQIWHLKRSSSHGSQTPVASPHIR